MSRPVIDLNPAPEPHLSERARTEEEYWVFQDKSFKRACIHRSNCSVRQGAVNPFRGDLARHVPDLRGSMPHGGGFVPSKRRPAKLPPLPPAKLLNNGSPTVTQRRPRVSSTGKPFRPLDGVHALGFLPGLI